MTSFAGGGGAIYKDGNAVNEELGASESITVPAGETWVVTITVAHGGGSGAAGVKVNTQNVIEGSSSTGTKKSEMVLSDGDTITGFGGNTLSGVEISGWSV